MSIKKIGAEKENHKSETTFYQWIGRFDLSVYVKENIWRYHCTECNVSLYSKKLYVDHLNSKHCKGFNIEY